MTYDPKKYKDQFPRGLFEFENKLLQTWDDSHRLFALNTVPQKKEIIQLASGLTLEKGNIKLARGFSNYMITTIDPALRKIDINFLFGKPRYPLEIFESLPNPKYLTNLGYFYLTDNEKYDPVKPPKVRIGNLVIQNGKVINLPILDRSAILLDNNGQIDLKFIRSRGTVLMGDATFTWKGSKSDNTGDLIIYNSSNIEMDYINHPVMGPSRTAKKTFISPPKGGKLLICKRTSFGFVVDRITKLKTVINDKDMVIEADENLKVSLRSKLEIIDIDNIDIKMIKAGVSAGPMIYRDSKKTAAQVQMEKFGIDMANPNNPHEPEKKMARGVLIKLKDGRVVSLLVDGIPQAANIYPGITLKELSNFIFTKYHNIETVICTDPSSTMKCIYRHKGVAEVFGNLHYLAHKREPNGEVKFWPNGRLGRKINSMLVVY